MIATAVRQDEQDDDIIHASKSQLARTPTAKAKAKEAPK